MHISYHTSLIISTGSRAEQMNFNLKLYQSISRPSTYLISTKNLIQGIMVNLNLEDNLLPGILFSSGCFRLDLLTVNQLHLNTEVSLVKL